MCEGLFRRARARFLKGQIAHYLIISIDLTLSNRQHSSLISLHRCSHLQLISNLTLKSHCSKVPNGGAGEFMRVEPLQALFGVSSGLLLDAELIVFLRFLARKATKIDSLSGSKQRF